MTFKRSKVVVSDSQTVDWSDERAERKCFFHILEEMRKSKVKRKSPAGRRKSPAGRRKSPAGRRRKSPARRRRKSPAT
jgi:hypothetical protein